MAETKSEILRGTLGLMVLTTLTAMPGFRGYAIARPIEQISEPSLEINQGTTYASLVRLQQRGWISAALDSSENNRRAKLYCITKVGRKRLSAEAANREPIFGVIGGVTHISERS